MPASSIRANVHSVFAKARVWGMKTALFGARGLSWGASRLRSEVTRTVQPDEAAELTRWEYSHARSYRREQTQTLGLHTFERSVVDRFFPAAPAKILVLGCGGGREIVALQARGYECVGSEPAQVLLDAAVSCSAADTILRLGRIEDARQHGCDGPFAAIVVGWGAWGYVLRRDERLAAMREFAALCPTGPILLSWQFYAGERPHSGGARDGVPQTWTGGPNRTWRDQVRVSPGRGIAVELSAAQIAEEAENSGLSLLWDGTGAGQYPHVVLRS